MKKDSKIFGKIAHNGFYIILFLCISAIGISGYVMYLARNTAETVKEELSIENSLELPFPTISDDVYETMKEPEVPVVIEEGSASAPEEEFEPEPEAEEPVAAVSNMPEEEPTVYTMALVGAIAAPFSGDELVKSETMGDWRIHAGVDIKGELGKEVFAIADGTVKSVLTDTMMGNTVTVEHKDGIVSIYANLQDGIALKEGESIKGGSVIGKVGSSSLAECMQEPHLHLEVKKDGKSIDPLSLFPAGEE